MNVLERLKVKGLNRNSHTQVKVSCQECKKESNREARLVYNILDDNGKYVCLSCSKNFSPLPKSLQNISGDIGENYFAEIDTEEKAYVLGWISASGWRFRRTDYDIRTLENRLPSCWSNFLIKSEKMTEDICRVIGDFGNPVFPVLYSDDLRLSFIRGYFDRNCKILKTFCSMEINSSLLRD